MSIICVDFHALQAIKAALDFTPWYLKRVEQDHSLGLTNLCEAALQTLSMMPADCDFHLPPGMKKAVAEFHPYFKTSDYQHELGRRGLRGITSRWAKEKYPKATHELLITLVDLSSSRDHVQTFLVFL